MSNRTRQFINGIAVLITIGINGLATSLPLNNQTTGEISDRFLVYFVPAGYVFAIWGVIYLGLIAFAVYQALPSQRDNPVLRALDAPFIVSNAANSAWIFLWHYEQLPLTVVAMLTLLVSLCAIYIQLGVGRKPATSAMRWLVRVPFSIYLGWVSVATIANITDWLYSLQWDGFGLAPQTWAAIMLGVAVALGVIIHLQHRDTAYLLVFVWAFAGIGVKFPAEPLVSSAAWLAAMVCFLMALTRLWNPFIVPKKGTRLD
ncbi:MAG: hypothetical protein OHK0052_12630 [Anaerolineales bacterium]